MRAVLAWCSTAALLLPLLAQAQVTRVTTSHTVTTTPGYSVPASMFPKGSGAADGAYDIESGNSTGMAGSNVQLSAQVTPTYITFANNATSQGDYTATVASTTVVVDYTNGGAASVTPVLNSTIIPGGFGFYVDDQTKNPTATGGAVGDINQSPQAADAIFTDANQFGEPTTATAAFSYAVYSGADPTPVFSVSDSVTLSLTLNGGAVGYTVDAGAAPALTNFRLVTPAGSDAAVAYQWDVTTENDIPLGVTLGPGASSSLTFVSTVSTSTAWEDACGSLVCPSLLAYAGFGDPIGKASGVKGVSDPYFPVFDLSLPTFDPATGVVGGGTIRGVAPSLAIAGVTPATFEPIPSSVLGPVPEPGTWMLMLTGLGGVGWGLRGRARVRPA
jgi:hypothetical protein